MCGIAEFRCQGLSLADNHLRDIMNGFTYFHDKLKGNQDLIVVTQYNRHCLCDPTDQEKKQFLQIVETLAKGSKLLAYSPNDYSGTLSQCTLETLHPEEAVEQFWPSLETPPMRITIRAD